ncbi:hypothetical protein HKX48_005479 [Thoreauomyces humboldtii]|nr:hypothetical protein HKX48_005479 [Thoreauomyces humboldtii]
MSFSPGTSLQAIDDTFTSAYARFRTRQISWDRMSVLIVRGNVLTLLYRKGPDEEPSTTTPPPPPQSDNVIHPTQDLGRKTYTFETPLFHQLKAYCHIPLAILAIVTGRVVGEDASVVQKELRIFARQIMDVRDAMEGTEGAFLTEEQRIRNAKLVDESMRFVNRLRHGDLVEEEVDSWLGDFLKGMKKVFEKNVMDATRNVLECLDAKVKEILCEGSYRTKGKELHIAIEGEHMPADGNSIEQYFLAATNTTKEGDGVYLTSSKMDDDEVVTFIAQHLVDGTIGSRVYGNPDRMHKDVLAPAAEQIIDEWKMQKRLPIKELARSVEGKRIASSCPFIKR